MPIALYTVNSSLNTNTPISTAVNGSSAPKREVSVGPANLMAFTRAIMMMAMNMVSFAADTAPAETEAVESVTRSTNGESVLLDKVYFACDGKNTISSREPIPATALDIENRILGSMEYFYDGLDSSGRPQYTVKASMTSNPLKLKSSKLVTRAEGVNSWHTNEEDHNGYTGTNSRSYVYTTPNPPSNPYCEAILTATDEKGDEYAVWKGTLRDAK